MFLFDKSRAMFGFACGCLAAAAFKIPFLLMAIAGTTVSPVKFTYELVTFVLFTGIGGTYFLNRKA